MKKIFIKHLVSILILTSSCLVLIIFFGFTLSGIKEKTAKALELKEKLVSYQINKKAFNEEVQKINNLESRVVDLQKNIIKEETVPELLSNLEALAGQNNISFEITGVQNIKSESGNKLSLETKTVGSYREIINFLNLLRKQTFLINIKNIYLFSDQVVISDTQDIKPGIGEKTTQTIKEPKWQGVVTIEILSVE